MPEISEALRKKLDEAKLPSQSSGKASVRHLLRSYADIACDVAEHPFSNTPQRVGGQLPAFVIEDGSVTFMNAVGRLAVVPPKTTDQLRSALCRVSARTVFERVSARARWHLAQPHAIAHVFGVDKQTFVPLAKREEQQQRDASFRTAYQKTVTSILSETQSVFPPMAPESCDAKRISACEDANALLVEFLGEDGGKLNAVACGLTSLDALLLPRIVWTLLVQCRTTRAAIIDFFMRLDDEWRRVQTPGKALYRDWESPKTGAICIPPGAANSVGECDVSWICWDKFLREHHEAHADRGMALLTVDTDVILIALLYQTVLAEAAPRAPLLCMLNAGENRRDLWIDSGALHRMVEHLFSDGVRGLVRSTVLSGGSDFTDSAAFPGVSIMRSVDCARGRSYPSDSDFMRAVYARGGERALATARRVSAKTKRKREGDAVDTVDAVDAIVARGLARNAAAAQWTEAYWRAHMHESPATPNPIPDMPAFSGH